MGSNNKGVDFSHYDSEKDIAKIVYDGWVEGKPRKIKLGARSLVEKCNTAGQLHSELAKYFSGLPIEDYAEKKASFDTPINLPVNLFDNPKINNGFSIHRDHYTQAQL